MFIFWILVVAACVCVATVATVALGEAMDEQDRKQVRKELEDWRK